MSSGFFPSTSSTSGILPGGVGSSIGTTGYASYQNPQLQQKQQQPYGAQSSTIYNISPSSYANCSMLGSRVLNWLLQRTSDASEWLLAFTQQAPTPLVAFVLCFAAFAAIPIASFLTLSIVSSFMTLGVVLTGFALVEGSLFLMGGGALLAVLAVVGCFTSFVFSWVGLLWYGSKGVFALVSRVAPSLIGSSIIGSSLSPASSRTAAPTATSLPYQTAGSGQYPAAAGGYYGGGNTGAYYGSAAPGGVNPASVYYPGGSSSSAAAQQEAYPGSGSSGGGLLEGISSAIGSAFGRGVEVVGGSMGRGMVEGLGSGVASIGQQMSPKR